MTFHALGIDTDDLMDTAHSDADGRFTLSGDAAEFGTIDPKLNIYHDCEDILVSLCKYKINTKLNTYMFQPCQRKVTIHLPETYVTKGSKTPKKVYDVGEFELSGKYIGETRDCIH